MKKIKELLEKITTLWKNFNSKEKALILGGCSIILLIAFVEISDPIIESFGVQEIAVLNAKKDLDTTLLEINKYTKLKSRHSEIENSFKRVEMKVSMLSYLEQQIKEKAGVISGFTIKPKAVRAFGGRYEQVPFSVTFSTNDMGKLMAFMTELEQGKHPLIVASVDLKRKLSNDGLNVELEVSSLRERSQNTGE